MTLHDYISKIDQRFQGGRATEHSYRGDLQGLIESILPDHQVTNEPKRSKAGAPDYIITKGKVPNFFMEAKDIGDSDLEGKKANKEQFNRYLATGDPYIFTDYLRFRFFKDGTFVEEIVLGEFDNGKIRAIDKDFDRFVALIKDYSVHYGQTIKSSKKLAQLMAGKARLLANVIENALIVDENEKNDSLFESANNTLRDQLEAFQKILIHDISAEGFSDIYAQTIAYGMFAARLHDKTLDDFDRHEAATLIPKSNPFLRKLFQYIAGYDLDDRLVWIVDSLADVFRATNVAELLKDFGKSTGQDDPIIHFYETFLSEYDPKLRKARGVWYTPKPVVNFIVRAVDDILKDEFGLKDGLASTEKVKIKVKTTNADKRTSERVKMEEKEVHKVQILDPATGTGTFLAEVIKHIHQKFKGQGGLWSQYVEEHLIPRLNGFEILMASYAMAHLKLDLLLQETGYQSKLDQRFKIYLTNSLEEHHPDTGTLFANWLSTEASEANEIKRDCPVMVVIGNPPYSVSSTNKGAWIENLIADYKKYLNEKSYNSLSDDYVKFIRYGQHFIDKNGFGEMAYISNNSFIDGIVFRQMRKNLLLTFDDIYIIDLHGNSKKKEVAPDGSPDQNVFDIMQGVSINIFVKTGTKKKNELGQIHHLDLFGKRDAKYDFLNSNLFEEINWNNLKNKDPEYYFLHKDFSRQNEYEKGMSMINLYNSYSSGVQTEFDGFAIQDSSEQSYYLLNDLNNLSVDDILYKYKIDNKYKIKVQKSKDDILRNTANVKHIQYRPFDIKSCVYTGVSNGIMGRPRGEVMYHFNQNDNNIGIVTKRGLDEDTAPPAFVTSFMLDRRGWTRPGMQGAESIFPLYLYPESNGQQSISKEIHRKPNLNTEMVAQIAKGLGLEFLPDHEDLESPDHNKYFSPLDLLDYIYAVLHSPNYREKYKEFLKIDFPRVPYPNDKDKFWKLVNLGSKLRALHLMEADELDNYITSYPIQGSNEVARKTTKKDWEINENGKIRLWINDEQYFDDIPEVAFNFYIGGYQPAQKWLKDRHSRILTYDDIIHYQRIIVALTETDKIMKQIDEVGVV